jgi:large conductance mechanosensitive channel
MSMVKEFREFALKGNMVDMAVGIIIGGAFGGLVKSIVDHIMMPPLGLVIGGMDFSDFKLVLHAAVMEGDKVLKPEVALQYGAFITVLINFTIVAFALFLVVKAINTARARLEPPKAPPPPKGPSSEELLTDIRNLLRAKA